MKDHKKEIKQLLRDEGPLSTYKISQEVGLSWGPTNSHLKDLVIEGEAVVSEESDGARGKKMWRLRDE